MGYPFSEASETNGVGDRKLRRVPRMVERPHDQTAERHIQISRQVGSIWHQPGPPLHLEGQFIPAQSDARAKSAERGRPLRIFYAFDPLRTAILLIGGDKTGDDRFYARYVPVADRIYDRHLDDLRRRGLI